MYKIPNVDDFLALFNNGFFGMQPLLENSFWMCFRGRVFLPKNSRIEPSKRFPCCQIKDENILVNVEQETASVLGYFEPLFLDAIQAARPNLTITKYIEDVNEREWIKSEIVGSFDDWERLPHDLVCVALWGSQGDMPFSSWYIAGTSSDRRTPDFLKADLEVQVPFDHANFPDGRYKKLSTESWVKKELSNLSFKSIKEKNGRIKTYISKRKFVLCCEIKTTGSSEDAEIHSRFIEAATYEEILKSRSEEKDVPVLYCRIVIGSDKIKSDLFIPEDKKDLINSWAHAGRKIFSQLGLKPTEQKKTLDKSKRNMELSLLSIETLYPAFKSNLNFTQEDVDEIQELRENEIIKKSTDELIKCIQDSKVETAKAVFNQTNIDKEKFIIEWDSQPKNDSMKAVVQLPLFFPYLKSHFILADFHFTTETVEASMWRQIQLVLNEDMEKIHVPDLEGKSTREKKQLISHKLNLDEDQFVELAKKGVWGLASERRFPHREKEIRSHKTKNKSIFYHRNTLTTDISSFIENEGFKWLWTKMEKKTPSHVETENLLECAIKHSGHEKGFEEVRKTLNEFEKLPIFRYLDLWSEIAMEVNLQRRTNLPYGNVLVRKLKHFPCYLMIVPTQKDKHIFFSLICLKRDNAPKSTLPFKTASLETDQIIISEFISWNKHDISFFISLKQTLASTLLHFSLNFRNAEELAMSADHLSSEAKKHFLLSLLIALENKEETSKDLQIARYMYMEMEKQHLANPFKVTSKLSTKIRSRLHCFVIKRYLSAFQKMRDISSSMPMISKSLINRVGSQQEKYRLSWLTEKEINFKMMLAMSYMGVFHNKEKSEETAGFMKIFEKVLKMEKKVDEVVEIRKKKKQAPYSGMRGGSYSHDELLDHEFNRMYVSRMGDVVRTTIVSQFGEGEISNLLTDKLSRITWSSGELATFKSSSNFEEDQSWREMTEEDKKYHGSRSRVFENISDVMDTMRAFAEEHNLIFYDDPCPFANLHIIIKMHHEQENGALFATLFKKLQLGGEREIFVLSILSRLIVMFAERVAMTICDHLPNEFLSKPNERPKFTINHIQEILTKHKVRIANKEEVISYCDSGDSATWAQQFVMPAFITLAARIFRNEDKKWMKPLLYVFNACTAKRLQLPRQLLAQFEKHPKVFTFFSGDKPPGMVTLKREFIGIEKPTLLSMPYGTQIKNESNFMQGIFHFWSSVMHASHQLLFSQFSSQIFKSKGLHNFVITNGCSSDDFANMRSVICDKEKNDGKDYQLAHFICRSLCSAEQNAYKLWCARVSVEKSTIGLPGNVIELNSMFYISGEMFSVPLKFIVAGTQTPKTFNFERRNFEFANLRADLVSNGGSIFESSFLNIMQLQINYNCLGASLLPQFSEYSSMLCRNPHPMLGFFLLELPFMAGIAGWRSSLYNLLKASARSRSIHSVFHSPLGELVEEDMTMGKIRLLLGKKTKAINIQTYLGVSKELRERYCADFEGALLYMRGPKTFAEAHRLVNNKALDDNLPDILAFLNAAEVSVASVYTLTKPCITSASFSEKKSLIDILKLFDKKNVLNVESDFMEKWFPDAVTMESFIELSLNTPTVSQIAPRERQWKSTINVLITGSVSKSSMRDTLVWIWSKKKIMTGTEAPSTLELSWKDYQSIFPWLSDTYEKTIENTKGIFPSRFTLINFINQIVPRNKTISVLGPALGGKSGTTSLRQIINKCFKPSLELVSYDPKIRLKSSYTIQEFLADANDYMFKTFSRRPEYFNGNDDYAINASNDITKVFKAAAKRFDIKNVDSVANTIPNFMKPLLFFLKVCSENVKREEFTFDSISQLQEKRFFHSYIASEDIENNSVRRSLCLFKLPSSRSHIALAYAEGREVVEMFFPSGSVRRSFSVSLEQMLAEAGLYLRRNSFSPGVGKYWMTHDGRNVQFFRGHIKSTPYYITEEVNKFDFLLEIKPRVVQVLPKGFFCEANLVVNQNSFSDPIPIRVNVRGFPKRSQMYMDMTNTNLPLSISEERKQMSYSVKETRTISLFRPKPAYSDLNLTRSWCKLGSRKFIEALEDLQSNIPKLADDQERIYKESMFQEFRGKKVLNKAFFSDFDNVLTAWNLDLSLHELMSTQMIESILSHSDNWRRLQYSNSESGSGSDSSVEDAMDNDDHYTEAKGLWQSLRRSYLNRHTSIRRELIEKDLIEADVLEDPEKMSEESKEMLELSKSIALFGVDLDTEIVSDIKTMELQTMTERDASDIEVAYGDVDASQIAIWANYLAEDNITKDETVRFEDLSKFWDSAINLFHKYLVAETLEEWDLKKLKKTTRMVDAIQDPEFFP